MEQREEELLRIFAASVRELLKRSALDYDKLQEVRLRVQAPLLIRYGNIEYYIGVDGRDRKSVE